MWASQFMEHHLKIGDYDYDDDDDNVDCGDA